MNLPGLIGNEKIKAAIAVMTPERFPHAAVIEGPSGIGKKTVARLIAAALVCKNTEQAPCLRCPACGKAEKNEHPDIFTVDNTDGKMPVEKVREIRMDAFVRPSEADRKVYLILGADRLSVPCQNALLKVLEEPPAFVHFLLLCENSGALLETVRSRVMRFSLEPLSEDQLTRTLLSKDPKLGHMDAKAAAVFAGGVAGRAMALLEDQPLEFSERAQSLSQALCAKDELWLFQTVRELEALPGDRLEILFSAVQATMRNAAFCKISRRDFCAPVFDETIQLIKDGLSEHDLCAFSGLLGKLSARLGRHANKTAVLGSLCAESVQIWNGIKTHTEVNMGEFKI